MRAANAKASLRICICADSSELSLLADEAINAQTSHTGSYTENAYLCFISFLYLDLYVFGDDALISWGPFMQTKHLCVFIHV